MGQTSLDDDLFGEAADDLRGDIDESLAAARAALPDPDDVWAADADNVLGVLNGVRSALDAGDAQEHVRDAKKWYAMGERAEAFDDPEALLDEIESVEALVAEMAEAREQVSDLAGTLPELRGNLEEAHAAAESAEDGGAEDDGSADDDEAAPADADGDTPEAEADGGQPQDGDEQATLDEE